MIYITDYNTGASQFSTDPFNLLYIVFFISIRFQADFKPNNMLLKWIILFVIDFSQSRRFSNCLFSLFFVVLSWNLRLIAAPIEYNRNNSAGQELMNPPLYRKALL